MKQKTEKKAYITKDTKSDDGKLWLIIERAGAKDLDVKAILEMFGDHNGVAHPILEDEVSAILNACIDYLDDNARTSNYKLGVKNG